MQQTVTIPRKEYEHLKQLEKVDMDMVAQFAKSLEDLKKGRFKKIA